MHIRDGAALLLHAAPAYTVADTRAGPYALLVAQAADGYAFGTAYVDDGESVPPTPNATLVFRAREGALEIEHSGSYRIEQKLETVTLLGAAKTKPTEVVVNGERVSGFEFDAGVERLVVKEIQIDLNERTTITWK